MVAFASAFPHPARAQLQPPPQAASLASIATGLTPAGETRLVLTFAPHAPKFSVLRDATDHPGIAFAQSSRGTGAVTPAGMSGDLRAISFDQEDSVLILNFAASGPVGLKVAALNDTQIAIVFASRPAAPPPGADQTAAAGPLPHEQPPPPGQSDFEVVPLKYADVSEVVGLLTNGLTVKSNDNFTPQEPAFGSAGMTGAATYAAPAAPNPEDAGEPVAQSVDDTIGIDRRLNAIILKGSPDRIAQLKQEIALIDVPVESVLLETVFVELDKSGAHNLGLDFNNASNQIGVATLTTGAFDASNPTSMKPLGSLSVQGALYAQVSAGHGRIVSKPRIAAQSGSTAKIITGDALPILTAITLSGVNAVSQQVQYVNVGVTLQIAPRVSDDGFVTSHVFCVVSSVTGTSQGYPTISQREASTSATVRDGETFVIGGLTEDSNISSVDRLPGVADVPGLGELFKMRSGTASKTELYIVVTPHIIHHGDGSAALPPDPPADRWEP